MADTFKLIVITPEKDSSEEVAEITGLLRAGLQLLHIRKPSYSLRQMSDMLEAIPSDFHSKIVVHNNYELLNDFNLKGAHLPERIRKEEDIDEVKKIVSTSFHNLKDIIAGKINFEYAFFSPVFQSVSKQEYKPSVESKTLHEFFQSNKNQIPFPIIALGGITDKNILPAKEMGFSGAASLGYIWENSNPVEQFKRLQNIFQG